MYQYGFMQTYFPSLLLLLHIDFFVNKRQKSINEQLSFQQSGWELGTFTKLNNDMSLTMYELSSTPFSFNLSTISHLKILRFENIDRSIESQRVRNADCGRQHTALHCMNCTAASFLHQQVLKIELSLLIREPNSRISLFPSKFCKLFLETFTTIIQSPFPLILHIFYRIHFCIYSYEPSK